MSSRVFNIIGVPLVVAYIPIYCRVALNYNWKSIRHVKGLVKINGFIFRSLSSVLKTV